MAYGLKACSCHPLIVVHIPISKFLINFLFPNQANKCPNFNQFPLNIHQMHDKVLKYVFSNRTGV